jgi:RHS repeat-associated protein
MDRASGTRRRWMSLLVVLAMGATLLPAAPALSQSEGGPAEAVQPTAPPAEDASTREIESRRTQTSRTFLTADGLYRTELFPGSIHYRDAVGGWEPIDNTLVPSIRPGYAYQNRANRYAVHLPSRLDGAPVRVESGTAWMAFSLEGATGSPAPAGRGAAYANAMPGVSVSYVPANDGVKETITLSKPPTPNSPLPTGFRFPLELSPGLTAVEDGTGGIQFLDLQGKAAFAFAAPFAWDASGAESPEGAVSLHLVAGTVAPTVELLLDPAWFSDPKRRWPIKIDPTLTIDPQRDCHISSGGPNSSSCAQPFLRIGQNDGSKRRILLRFDLSSIPAQSTVHQADLRMYLFDCVGSNFADVSVHRLTRLWFNGATWNTYNGTNAWTTPGGDFSSERLSTATFAGSTANFGYKHWYPTGLVQDWIDRTVPNDGLLMKFNNESMNQLFDFVSTDDPSSARWPKLEVVYSPGVGERRDWTFDTHRLNDRMDLKVNVATGNLMLQARDLEMTGTGLDLSVTRTFNSLMTSSSELGPGWVLGPKDVRLSVQPGGDALLHGETGTQSTFQRKPDGSFKQPIGIDAKLTKNSDGTNDLKWNSKEEWGFQPSGRLWSMKDKNGNRIILSYDSSGLTSITDTQGRRTTFTYSGTGTSRRVETVKDVAGDRTYDYEYTNGRLTSFAVTSHKYEDKSNLNTTTYYSYDAAGNLVKITDPRGNETRLTYDGSRRVKTITRVTRLTTDVDPQTKYDYFAGDACPENGQATENVTGKTVVTDPRLNQTTHCHNDKGQILKTVDAKGNKQEKTYTAQGNVATYTEAGAPSGTLFEWSANGNLTGVKLPTTGLAKLNYDESSINPHFPIGVEDFATQKGDNHRDTWEYEYNGEPGNLTKAHNQALGVTFTYGYNGNGTLARIDPPPQESDASQGNDTLFTYDAKGNLTKIDPPGDHGTMEFTYDDVSRVKTITDGKGQKQIFTYDAFDRVTRIEYREGGLLGTLPPVGTDRELAVAGKLITYVYDPNGNMETRLDNMGATVLTYDELNRIRKEAPEAPAATITYDYDLASNLTSAKYSDQPAPILYTYDSVDLVDSVTDQRGRRTQFTYDKRQLREKTIYPNGVTMEAKWDDSRRTKWIVSYPTPQRGGCIDSNGNPQTGGSTTCLTHFAYNYTDPVTGFDTNTRYSVTDRAGRKTSYRYDEIGRLKEAQTPDPSGAGDVTKYVYKFEGDAGKRGNITGKVVTGSAVPNQSVNYTYNGANELVSDSTGTYDYDLNGNLTRRTDGLALAYNLKNQTSSMTPPGAEAITMEYQDATQDRRVRAGEQRMGYDVLGLGTQGPNVGQSSTWWVRDNEGTLVSQLDRDATSPSYWYLLDGLGSVVGLTDASGQVVARYDYDPYGKQTSAEPQVLNPWRYASGYYDVEAKVLKFGTRYYDPNVMRWTQMDPERGGLSDPMSLNPYAYVGCDPVNRIDPSGRVHESPECRTVTAIGGGLALASLVGIFLAPPTSGLSLVFSAITGTFSLISGLASYQMGCWSAHPEDEE